MGVIARVPTTPKIYNARNGNKKLVHNVSNVSNVKLVFLDKRLFLLPRDLTC